MAHQEKTLTANPQDQSSIPGTLRWKEITDSSRLSYDPHSYAVHSCPLHPHKLNESVNVKAVLNWNNSSLFCCALIICRNIFLIYFFLMMNLMHFAFRIYCSSFSCITHFFLFACSKARSRKLLWTSQSPVFVSMKCWEIQWCLGDFLSSLSTWSMASVTKRVKCKFINTLNVLI